MPSLTVTTALFGLQGVQGVQGSGIFSSVLVISGTTAQEAILALKVLSVGGREDEQFLHWMTLGSILEASKEFGDQGVVNRATRNSDEEFVESHHLPFSLTLLNYTWQ